METTDAEPSLTLLPASRFSIEELTAAYNGTRADYMIPMPMDADHLADYLHIYDVDLSRSWVAVQGERPVGLAMLGVRPGRAWVTRLGVLSSARHSGLGERLVRALLDSAREAGLPLAILEVIQGNQAAHALFRKLGFTATRGLLVLRRAPTPVDTLPVGQARWTGGQAALDLLAAHPIPLPWTNEPETFQRAGDARALIVELPSGERGWMVYRRQPRLLSHFVMHTERGEPAALCRALFSHLYNRYPALESYVENVPVSDPHAPELLRQGFHEAFRRVEMHRRESDLPDTTTSPFP